MLDNIEEAAKVWLDNYSFIEQVDIVDYKGGYPVVDFVLKEEVFDLVSKNDRSLKKIAKSAEIEGGIAVGVSYCFRDTSFIKWNPPRLTICGYPEVIDRILKKAL